MDRPDSIVRLIDFRERFDRARRGESLDALGPSVAEVVRDSRSVHDNEQLPAQNDARPDADRG